METIHAPLEMSLFRDIVAACGKGDQCYVRNDGLTVLDADLSLEAWACGAEIANEVVTFKINVAPSSICKFATTESFIEEFQTHALIQIFKSLV
jgi:hypothetical protein